jgi:hypothetical protein
MADGKSSHDPLSDELKRLKLVHIFIPFIMLFSSINQLTTFLNIWYFFFSDISFAE